MRRSKPRIYDAYVLSRVANVVIAAALACALAPAVRARTMEDLTLAVIDGGVQRSEDAPFAPANFEFLPGEYLYFTFHISGFKTKANETGEIKSLSLQYQITPQDLNGVSLAEPVDGAITEDIHNEDKNWTPKRRASFLLPSFVASGECRVHVVVKDLIANTQSSRDYPFRTGGTQIPPSSSIRADRFEFLRDAEDTKPVEISAFAPGDSIFARFIMSGFKLEPGNKYRLSYGIKVLRPDGKTFLDDPKAAEISAGSFYPAPYIPGSLQITTPRNAMHGQYLLTLTVRDLVANQSFEIKQVFSIE